MVLAAPFFAAGQVDVLTANYGNDRAGANLAETILTTSNINSGNFGKLFVLPVDGPIYAQPLYASALSFAGSATHNVVFVATLHNSVYAFDADAAGAPLWQANLGPAVPSRSYAFSDIEPEVGILSTPVIDRASNTLYAVANTLENGQVLYRLHALDLMSG
ncbi:MAG: hypothetical protein ACREH9_10035, partial [Pseudomonadota bacterium]